MDGMRLILLEKAAEGYYFPASSTGKKTLKGEVAKKYWDALTKGQAVTVRYSRDNPDIVSLEGE
jgi:hypothetical protein